VTQVDDGENGFYFQFVEERARYLTGWLQRRGKDLQLAAGDTLRDAITKWLIRETLFQSDRAIARRAALEYRDLRRAQQLFRKNRRNARLPRTSADMETIAAILRGDPKLTWKRIAKRAAQLGKPLKGANIASKVFRVRKMLKAAAVQDAWLSRGDAN
jgi:hypothetical protein